MSKSHFEAADVFIVHNHIKHGYCVVLFEDAKRKNLDALQCLEANGIKIILFYQK